MQCFSTDFQSYLLKNLHMKFVKKKTWTWVLPFCVQQSVSVTLQMGLACVGNGSNTSWANPSLLFLDKEWTNTAVHWGEEIWSKKAFPSHKCWQTKQTRHADENISTFSVFRPTCVLALALLIPHTNSDFSRFKHIESYKKNAIY